MRSFCTFELCIYVCMYITYICLTYVRFQKMACALNTNRLYVWERIWQIVHILDIFWDLEEYKKNLFDYCWLFFWILTIKLSIQLGIKNNINFCIPESFNMNISHHLFDYTITFVKVKNSLHTHHEFLNFNNH